MRFHIKKWFVLLSMFILASYFPLSETWSQSNEEESLPDGVLQQRIDFSNSHILGQSIKSGAVYLMHRKKSDISSMIEVRKDYRQEIKEEYRFDEIGKTHEKRHREDNTLGLNSQ